MKKPKKRAAQKQKRIQKRREQRRKRRHVHDAGGPPERGGPGLRTWVTDPMAMRISGRGTVAVLVPEGAHAWLVGVRFDLFSGGYLDTCDMRVAGASALSSPSWSASGEIGRRLFGEEGELAVWGRHLQPAPVSLASRLVWGAVAYRSGYGLDDTGPMPALGYLLPPPGQLNAWLEDFLERFDESQFAVIDTLSEEQLQDSEADGAWVDVNVVRVEVELETETPLATSVELDRRPLEFAPVLGGGATLAWWWMPLPPRALDSAPRRPCGLVWMHSSGLMLLKVLGVEGATKLAMRLAALVPSLRLRTCHWSLGSEYLERDEDDDALVVPYGGLVVPREAVG